MSGLIFAIVVLVGSLFSITALRQFFVEPLPGPWINLAWFAAQVAPLLLPLPGVLAGSVRSVFLLCLFSLLYFIHGVLAMTEAHSRASGAFEILFALALTTVCAAYVRRHGRPEP